MIRAIRTDYYREKELVRRIASSWPINAVKNCVGYMRLNTYEATHAEVYSEKNGDLYAVIRNDVHGNTHIVYENPVTEQERKHG
jgi:hypothetical protein